MSDTLARKRILDNALRDYVADATDGAIPTHNLRTSAWASSPTPQPRDRREKTRTPMTDVQKREDQLLDELSACYTKIREQAGEIIELNQQLSLAMSLAIEHV